MRKLLNRRARKERASKNEYNAALQKRKKEEAALQLQSRKLLLVSLFQQSLRSNRSSVKIHYMKSDDKVISIKNILIKQHNQCNVKMSFSNSSSISFILHTIKVYELANCN